MFFWVFCFFGHGVIVFYFKLFSVRACVRVCVCVSKCFLRSYSIPLESCLYGDFNVILRSIEDDAEYFINPLHYGPRRVLDRGLRPCQAYPSETSWKTRFLSIASSAIILYSGWILKALIILSGCTDWSAPMMLACNKIRFSRHISSTDIISRRFALKLQF